MNEGFLGTCAFNLLSPTPVVTMAHQQVKSPIISIRHEGHRHTSWPFQQVNSIYFYIFSTFNHFFFKTELNLWNAQQKKARIGDLVFSHTFWILYLVPDGQMRLSQLAQLRGMHPDLIRRMIDNISFIADHFRAAKKEDKVKSIRIYKSFSKILVFTKGNYENLPEFFQNFPKLFWTISTSDFLWLVLCG